MWGLFEAYFIFFLSVLAFFTGLPLSVLLFFKTGDRRSILDVLTYTMYEVKDKGGLGARVIMLQ